MESQFYAHTNPASGGNRSRWEPLFTSDCPALSGDHCQACENLARDHGHLNKVAWWTAKFAEAMFPADREDAKAAREWGYVVGLWHDLGKFALEWQKYLARKGGADVHSDEATGTVDHSTAGAQHAVSVGGLPGYLLAYAISGHHSGLLDAIAEHACLEKRLKTTVAAYANAPDEVLKRTIPALPHCISQDIFNPAVTAMFTRMIFSALVDADFLATESFMNPAQGDARPNFDPTLLPRMVKLLEQHHAKFPSPVGKVAQARADVHAACISAAADVPGLFSLTVPTGGGKTLSSLAFALRHAITHGQQRIIYVIPFTSIIEQNAAVFSEVFRPLMEAGLGPVVLQHHSNFAPPTEERETTRSRLATENWDAPLVVTTAVQFYESLHAARTSSCRKLHHIANTVVILDEAQCLPVQYLRPCLDALRELSARYHTTAVLCTATQPEIRLSDDFPIGLEHVREIIPQPKALYETLQRVKLIDRGAMNDAKLAEEIAACEQVLVIVNTRRHAQELFCRLPKSEANFHLSALMCPAHREQVLATVRERLNQGLPVRLMSTQLIEAGVDVDFPRVYRALAGIDSVAQAAGRCNRNGRWEWGELHVFRSEHPRAETYFRETAQIAEQVFGLYGDHALGLAGVEKFFTLYYQGHRPPDGARWDAKDIASHYRLARGNPKLPFQFQYKEVSKKFRLIENEQVSVLVPFDKRASSLLKDLRNDWIPLTRSMLRGLQRYTVQIYNSEFFKNKAQFESLRDDQFHILICPELNYSLQFGLRFENNAFLFAG
jgi:CRISPR-associated endonuclease/helicase Cas3